MGKGRLTILESKKRKVNEQSNESNEELDKLDGKKKDDAKDVHLLKNIALSPDQML